MIRRTKGQNIFEVFNYIIMVLVMFTMLYPILHVIFASLSSPYELMAHQGPLLYPLKFNLAAYAMVFKNPMIVKGYGNTLFIVVVGTCINIALTSLAAYVLSRKNFMPAKVVTVFIVFTMFFQGGLIPSYLNVRSLGLYDSLFAIILPASISVFNLIIMRTGFEAIPVSLEESAKIDGAGHFTILWKIVLPLALPTIAVIVLYYAVAHWNGWFNAMIYLNTREKFPLQLVLREILIQNDTTNMASSSGVGVGDQEVVGETIKYAVIVVATLPILFVYPFLQKYFVKGVMVGAVKG